MISLDKEQVEDRDYLDLSNDIVIMENISIHTVLFTRVVMVAINMDHEDAFFSDVAISSFHKICPLRVVQDVFGIEINIQELGRKKLISW